MTSKIFKYLKSWSIDLLLERQIIWLFGAVILSIILQRLSQIPSFIGFAVLIAGVFASINVVKFFIPRKSGNGRWDIKYLLIAALFLMPIIKINFVYYNVFFHILFISFAIAILWFAQSSSSKKELLNRMKFLLILNLIILFIPCYRITIQQNNNKIWENELKWSDFKGNKPKEPDDFAAEISTEFTYRYNRLFNIPRVKSITIMNKNKSWASAIFAKYSKHDILKHEKIHFDITEWTRREFQDSINNLNRLSDSTVNNIFIHFAKIVNKRQAEYDSITNHGTNLRKQKEWNEKANRMLN